MMTGHERSDDDALWVRFLAGQALAPDEERRLREALSRDEGLRADLVRDAQIDGLLRVLASGDPGDAFVQEVGDRLRADADKESFVAAVQARLQPTAPSGPAAIERPRGRLRPWGLALGGAAIALVGVLAGRGLRPDGPAAPVSSPLQLPGRPQGVARTSGPESSRPGTMDPQREIRARALRVTGIAHRLVAGRRMPLAAGDEIGEGEGLATIGPRSEVELRYPDGSTVRARGDTIALTATDRDSKGQTVFLAVGALRAAIVAQPPGRPFVFETPHAAAVVQGTSLALQTSSALTKLSVQEGRVSFVAGAQRALVQSGQQAAVGDGVALAAGASPRFGGAVLVVGSAAIEPFDDALRRRLEALGFDVRVLTAGARIDREAADSNLIVVSASVKFSDLIAQFRDLEVPLVSLERHLLQDLGMTGRETDTGSGDRIQDVVIKAPLHPLAGGLSGTVRATMRPDLLRWATPGPLATWAATLPGQPTQAVSFGYEAGVPMPGGAAPARRVGLSLKKEAPLHMTEAGWTLFDAAARWAAEKRTDR